LHLAHEENPYAYQKQHREPTDKHAHVPGRFFLGFGLNIDPVLPQNLDQIGIPRHKGLERLAIDESAEHMIALDGDLGDFAFLDGSKELTVSGLEAGPLRLVKHIEKKNHHQAYYQPESQILIKWTQLEKPPDQQFQRRPP